LVALLGALLVLLVALLVGSRERAGVGEDGRHVGPPPALVDVLEGMVWVSLPVR
jgi:hypothetical protein